MFLRAIEDWNPTHCIVTFDVSAPTFRHEAFTEYKAHRPPTPPELRPQFDRVRQFMEAFSVPVFEMAGYEADDILGTLGAQAEAQHLDTLILTGRQRHIAAGVAVGAGAAGFGQTAEGERV